MSQASDDLSVADLERLLSSRKQQLDDLYRQRQVLQSQLQTVNHEIACLEGQRNHGSNSVPSRFRNARSLRDHVLEQLGQNDRGYSLADLADRILEAGYQSSSSNFRNVLYQCLYNTKDVFHDEKTGTYRLRSFPAATPGD